MSITKLVATAALGVTCLLSTANAAEIQDRDFKVIGIWGNLNQYTDREKPFWSERIPQASNHKISTEIRALTEVGLSGFEIMRLLKLGVFDFAHGVMGYVTAEHPVFEGVDLSGLAQDIDTARKISNAYRPVLDEAFRDVFDAKLLSLYPGTSQVLFCRSEVSGIDDLKGKKVRVYSRTLGDIAEGLGATGVTVPFGEVIPALQRGVVDCGVTGTMPGYSAKWPEVTSHLYALRLGWGMQFLAVNLKTWNSLDTATQEFVMAQVKDLEEETWSAMASEDAMGLRCATNTGSCSIGEPGTMTLVEPSAADLRKRDAILKDVVVARWAERCGADCAAKWNSTIGDVLGIKASAN